MHLVGFTIEIILRCTAVLNIKINLILPAALYPWGWFSFWQKWVKGCLLECRGGRCLGLTILSPSRANYLEVLDPQPPGAVKACPGCTGITLHILQTFFLFPSSINRFFYPKILSLFDKIYAFVLYIYIYIKCTLINTSVILKKFYRSVRLQLKYDGIKWRTGGEVKGKLANGVGSQYSSHYLGTWCIQHYYRWCAHLGCQ